MSSERNGVCLETCRAAHDQLRSVALNEQQLSPGEGEVLLALEGFALTTNNVTYMQTGDLIGYWQFFPASDPAWGCMPVWGYARVLQSCCPDVTVGERLYGLFPMASHLLMQPSRVRPGSLVDCRGHRANLPPQLQTYNRYIRLAGDSSFESSPEALQAILRPLFMTSFVYADFLIEASAGRVEQLVITSASSKTAIGIAACLQQSDGAPPCIGLTSEANRDFVLRLGCYAQVLAYSEINTISTAAQSAMVDMAGNTEIILAIHEHLQENLLLSSLIGMSHGFSAPPTRITGVRPTFFFAPSQIEKRSREWGREVFDQKFQSSWDAFLVRAAGWFSVERGAGEDAIITVYQQLLAGRVDPSMAHYLAFD